MGEPGGLPSMGSQSRTRLKRRSSSSSSSSRVQEVISDQSNFIFELWDVCCNETELDNLSD